MCEIIINSKAEWIAKLQYKINKIKIRLDGIGLDAYWSQFEDLN